ncbi:hypothetical protein TNCV_2487301 [Trichonephila clavipes]|uniref:Uncharacterized protein n=1 Tax=Trichonephila clavipes TaxID=2585209 RepID=A0A8X6VZV9_TRICX|nr:hypothetical protein TNCV_2487301 [Trichonephila clavipes]
MRFLWAKNVSPSDIHRQIMEVYRGEAMCRHHGSEICRSFEAGTDKIKNCTDKQCPMQLTRIRNIRQSLGGMSGVIPPPYSPNLAPIDYFLFPALKKYFSGRSFTSDSDIQIDAENWLDDQEPDYYQDG